MLTTDRYLKILRLQRGATEKEIKNAYRKYAFHFHPDRNSENGYLFPYLQSAYRALMEHREQGSPDGGHHGTARHDLRFVKERIKKLKPRRANRLLSVRVLKVTERSRQCPGCRGYGVIGFQCLPMAACQKCLGTGFRL